MRFALVFLFAILAIFSCRNAMSTDYPAGVAFYTQSTTNSVTITGPGSSIITNNIEANTYHTFHAAINSTNGGVFALDRGLDGVNWVVVGTNIVATNSIVPGEQTMTGKWLFARYRVYGTNLTGNILYQGGR